MLIKTIFSPYIFFSISNVFLWIWIRNISGYVFRLYWQDTKKWRFYAWKYRNAAWKRFIIYFWIYTLYYSTHLYYSVVSIRISWSYKYTETFIILIRKFNLCYLLLIHKILNFIVTTFNLNISPRFHYQWFHFKSQIFKRKQSQRINLKGLKLSKTWL